MLKHFLSFSLLLVLITCLVSPVQAQQSHIVISPNGKHQMEVYTTSAGEFAYKVVSNHQTLITDSQLGYEKADGNRFPDSSWSVERTGNTSHQGVWIPVWGKRASVDDCYNETVLTFRKGKEHFDLLLRAYDDGIAFRYRFPFTTYWKIKCNTESTDFRFSDDCTAWFYNGEYPNIGPLLLSDAEGKLLPIVTLRSTKNSYLAIHEADLTNGDPMVFGSKKGEKRLYIASSPGVNGSLQPGYQTAWRTILLGETIGQLVDSHIIELLNPDPVPGDDFSWVKPSVAVWDWRIDGAIWEDFTYGMNYASWVRMVDFAARQGFNYLVLDANWYGPEHQSESDPVKGDKANEVYRLIQYAKNKNVGVWLYLNDVGGRQYPIEETLRQYSQWGAVGVKYGFMKGTPEEKNQWTRYITRLCAENRLLVDYHDGPVHPYGQMRTYPNAVTREYCHAQLDAHRVFEPRTFVTSVFVNMIAGPLDMNNGMFDLRQGKTTRTDENTPVPSTVVSEAARTLIVFSGATILPDIPEYYEKFPDLLAFLSAKKMPWKESKTLAGEIGEYIVMMRRSDDIFLVAAATNEQARQIKLVLDFLPQGKYELTCVEDGEGAHYLTNREVYKTSRRQVRSGEKITLQLAPGGGSCLILKEIK